MLIDRYQIGPFTLTDCRSDLLLLERSVARISTDTHRDFMFQVYLDRTVQNVSVRGSGRAGAPSVANVLVLDMNEPVRMQRNACRLIAFFVPGEVIEEVFPDPEALHGRALRGYNTAHGAGVIQHVVTLAQNIAHMTLSRGARGGTRSGSTSCSGVRQAGTPERRCASGGARRYVGCGTSLHPGEPVEHGTLSPSAYSTHCRFHAVLSIACSSRKAASGPISDISG